MTNNQQEITKIKPLGNPVCLMDPKSDIVFKKIFGQHPDLIKSFLNNILPLPEGRLIEAIDYLTSEQTPRIPSMKNTIVDVKCTDQEGRIFIVEIQMQWYSSFDKRLLYGATKAFSQQFTKGIHYSKLCPVYGLAIINDVIEEKMETWYHHYRLIHNKNFDKALEGLELIFVELPKFKPQTFNHRKLGALWLKFLKEMNVDTVSIPEEFQSDPDLAKAVELAQESSYTREELEAYDAYLDAVSVELSIREDSYVKGNLEGKQEGKQEGLVEGEDKKAREIANNMIKKGLALTDIAEMTNLSIDILLQLAQGTEVTTQT